MNRKGEKIGWAGGWFGGFIWLLILSIVWLFQRKFLFGTFGIILFVVAIFCILHFCPWKHPKTEYWKLMLPIYILFFASVVMSIFAFDGLNHPDLHWYSFSWILTCFVPFVIVGKRTWNTFSDKPDNNTETSK